jgi:hypothetical protein
VLGHATTYVKLVHALVEVERRTAVVPEHALKDAVNNGFGLLFEVRLDLDRDGGEFIPSS